MAQHDLIIDNGPGAAVRTDMNAAIQALVTQSSGAIEPTVKYPGQPWLDTTVLPQGALKVRNLANTAWTDPTVSKIRAASLVLYDTAGVMRGQVFEDTGTNQPSWNAYNAAGTLLHAGTVFTTGNSPFLLAASGYQKFASGIIIQGGTASTNAGGDAAIAFPTAFPTAAIAVTATIYSGVGIAGTVFYGVTSHSLTASGCGFQARVMSPGAVAVAAVSFRWTAIGY